MGCKQHSFGKINLPSSQAALMLRAAVKSYCIAVKSCFAAVNRTESLVFVFVNVFVYWHTDDTDLGG